MLHHDPQTCCTNARVGSVGEEQVGETVGAKTQIRLWEWRPLVAEVCAVATDDGEGIAEGSVEACGTDKHVEVVRLPIVCLDARHGDALDVRRDNVDIVLNNRPEIAGSGCQSATAHTEVRKYCTNGGQYTI